MAHTNESQVRGWNNGSLPSAKRRIRALIGLGDRAWFRASRRVIILTVGVFAISELASGTEAAVKAQRFAPCPNAFNCVSSRELGGRHAIQPLAFADDPASAWSRLIRLIRSMPGSSLALVEDGYIRASFRTRIFGFIDDAEFQLDADRKRIDIKSASRVGYWDLGANRRRCEYLRHRFTQ